jgi:hypothetical protein
MRCHQAAVGVLVSVSRQQPVQQLVRAHSDGPVNVGHGHLLPALGERLPPGNGVQVIGVDQGAVHIEQHGPQ